jgi:SAM-dependent methyltransferase
MRLDDLDFGALYREHVARTSGGEKRAEDWDARAPAMRTAVLGGAYTEAFLARLDLTGCRTLLDVGCGPGTIALAVASRLEHVHGLDFSPGMLAALEEGARERGLGNVSSILRAWDDPWDGVPVCDVVVASRSTHVADMEAALAKLDAHARRRVYLTHRAGGRTLDAAVQGALGRQAEPPPDWLYVLAILRGMGIQPRLDFIESAGKLSGCSTLDDFLRRTTWSAGELSGADRDRLARLWETDGPRLVAAPIRWALVSWEK